MTDTADIDTDISHYTISEMLQILDMDELDENEIIQKTDTYSDENASNPSLSLFFSRNAKPIVTIYEFIINSKPTTNIS